MAVDYTKLLDGNSLKAIRTYITGNFQPLHANLTSIAALATNVTGLIKMTNGVASLDGTSYAPIASPNFTGTVTLPTSVKIGSSTSTGLVKYTNGVLSIDTSSYLTSHLYRPIKVAGTQKLANTSSTALDFVNSGNVVFEWVSSSNGVKASVDLSGVQPLDADLTAIAALTATSGFLKKTAADTWSLGSLSASDIPNLDASKITSGTFADARIASASTWNAKYTKPSGGIPASDLAESYILTSARGANNGVASLDADGKIPESQLPDSVTSGMEYKGTFDATSGSTISGLEKGWYYICSTAGMKNPDGTTGPSDGYEIGDWAVYNGSSDGWAKIDNSDKVSSVNGQTGAVIIPVALLTTTVGSEAITVDSNSLQVVTRNTTQTISGTKTFSGSTNFSSTNGIFFSNTSGYTGTTILGDTSNGHGLLIRDGHNWGFDVTLEDGISNYDYCKLKFHGQGCPGAAAPEVQGYIALDAYWAESYTNNAMVFKAAYLKLPAKGSIASPATLATLDDIGAAVSLTTTVGSEAITVGSDTLTLMTRDTAQDVTGRKRFLNSIEFGYQGTGGLVKTGSIDCSTGQLRFIGTSSYNAKFYGETSGNSQLTFSGQNGSAGKINVSWMAIKDGSTHTFNSYLQWPGDKGTSSAPETLACLSDITSAVGNVYTEQEALAILEGTAS